MKLGSESQGRCVCARACACIYGRGYEL